MRLVASVLLAAAVVLLSTARADAAGLCDTRGHFCIQLDTTSARVCTPMLPGALKGSGCEDGDHQVLEMANNIEKLAHGSMHVVDALVAKFDDWSATILLTRREAEPEMAGDAGARDSMAPWRLIYGQSHTDGWQVDAIRPPTLSRIHGVQVARLESRLSQTGADGSVAGRNIAFDVRTRNAAYLVTFDTVDAHAQQLAALADGAIATLDALPVKAAGDASDALAWLARAVMAAVVLVALGYLWGRRKGARRSIDARDLWPR